MNAPATSMPVLVTDLDHSLIATDLLHESLWSALSSDWRTPLIAMRGLMNGRAQLKSKLAQHASIDMATLPYNQEVLALLRNWRDKGGKTVLATAADQSLADQIAEHLGLFDEVHGSTPERNLKGKAKAELLVQHYGEGQFDYVGDSRADLAVWPHARRAITVGADQSLRGQVENMGHSAVPLHLSPTPIRNTKSLIKALRPHQWLKNLLVFLPMLAAHDFSAGTIFLSILSFIAFSLVASSVYLLNDLLDLSADRAHPRKRHRPLASGRLRIDQGGLLAPIVLAVGAVLALSVGPTFFATLAIYYLLTLTYSLDLKRRPIIDITTLSVLYTLRVVAGGQATGIEISVWLLAFSIFIFFSLATIKRQAELVDNLKSGRVKPKGRGYHVEDLQIISMLAIASGFVSVLVMALYVTSEQVALYYSRPVMLWGICLILLYWISRIAIITHRGEMNDDPVIYAVKDRASQICILLVLGLAVAGALA